MSRMKDKLIEIEDDIKLLKEQIAYNEKRIEYLVGYEDLGCDGTLVELQSCRGWLKTYQEELKEKEDELRCEGNDS